MKRILIALIAAFNIAAGNAQKIEITPQYGYQVGSKYNYYLGYYKLKASDQFGVTVDCTVGNDFQAEFSWIQQQTSVGVQNVEYPVEQEVSDITVNHFQFGVIRTFGYSDLVPFAGLSLGWSTFDPDRRNYGSNSTFTVGINGGIKYFFSDHVGVRLQTQLLFPIEWGGIYLSTGGGGISAGGTLVQMNFSGGLILALG